LEAFCFGKLRKWNTFMESSRLCPTCAALRSQLFEAIEKRTTLERSLACPERKTAALIEEYRAFREYSQRWRTCMECPEDD
jgi:hypothetical protein